MPLVNLNKKLNNLNSAQPMLSTSSKKKKIIVRGLIVLLVLLVVLILPVKSVYDNTKQAIPGGKVLLAGLKGENLDQMRDGIGQSKTAVKALNGALSWLFWLQPVPFIGGYYSDAKHFLRAGEYELEAAEIVTEILEPFKNELGLTGQATAGQDRVAQGVKVLNKILPETNQIETLLHKARLEAEKVDTGKYPETFRSQILRSRVEEAKNFIIGIDIVLSEHKEALLVAPGALGEPKPKTYLLLFQNDKEIRATGGFITAYAFLTLDKGRLSTSVSDDIYRLDEQLLKTCLNKICPLAPPEPIVKYLPEADGKPRSAWSMRDANISPDLAISMKEFERMYAMLNEKTAFDGIITIDTQVVEELISVTGPISVFDTTYSAENDKRCNCPNVIYELEHYAEVAAKGEADRKAVLGTLMQQLLAKILGAGPDKWPTLINTGIKLANDKHIMFYMHDNQTQAALGNLNWTGEIKKAENDYIHINDSNFAGGKSNLYVEEDVSVDVKIDKDGVVSNTVTIEYKNQQSYNTWLNGILRDYVRLYVPQGSTLINSKGSDNQVNTKIDEALDKTYFEAFITVRPQNSRTLSFEYTLPGKITGKNYPLLIQKQPGAKDHSYTIKINGKTKAEFSLTSDKELVLTF